MSNKNPKKSKNVVAKADTEAKAQKSSASTKGGASTKSEASAKSKAPVKSKASAKSSTPTKSGASTKNKVAREMGFYGKYIKRAFDIVISLPLIVLVTPVAAVIAVAIKLEDRGPVFFVQKRSGLHNKSFNLIKFRSMSVENDVHDFSHENHETKVGSFIRKTSLDELPQLFNILRGEMSFIGPRPWIEDYSKFFTKNQRRRLEVRPGLSGLAQIKSRNNLGIKQKLYWDIYYVDHLNFLTDCRVFLGTFKTLFDKSAANLSKGGIKNELEELRDSNAEAYASEQTNGGAEFQVVEVEN